jgi:hypothetical protein
MSRPSAELDQACPRKRHAVRSQQLSKSPSRSRRRIRPSKRQGGAFDQLIPLPLMIVLAMIVTDKFRDRVSEMALA